MNEEALATLTSQGAKLYENPQRLIADLTEAFLK